jgi:hypothetical protein
VFRLQTWHINNDDALRLDKGTSENDHARSYYDPDQNEMAITLEVENRLTHEIDPAAHCLVLAKLRTRWPTARITHENQ